MKVLIAGALVAASTAAAIAECSDTRVDLRGSWGSARFSVELAQNQEEIELGLMHRESLPFSAGMLFMYDAPKPIGFWMKNTLIPLDMVFAGADGIVRKVHENAVPLDETVIFGGTDIQFVLEINGGMAETLGIGVGSELRHPMIDQTLAAWRCESE